MSTGLGRHREPRAPASDLGFLRYMRRNLIQVDVNNGVNIGLDDQGNQVGLRFWAGTPAARPSAYTQTYTTADKTHAARTAAAVVTSPAVTSTPAGWAAISQADAIITNLNALRVDQLDTAQLVNSIVDDLQALGLVG